MKLKIVADSSANVNRMEGVEFASVPLKILVGANEYVDDDRLDVPVMLKDMRQYKGKTGTSCPGVSEWIAAFDGADTVLGVAITSNLSGCYNSARIAAQEYMQANPGAKVFILDSLSAGPELQLILEKYAELISAGKGFEEICEEIKAYHAHTHLMFSLESLDNFAKNGRVSPVVAKAVGMLGIRVVGRASEEGTLEPQHKCRGEKKALNQLVASMQEMGYRGGKVRITHSYNENGAKELAQLLHQAYPDGDITIGINRGLCCYYAEEGGLLVGFEG